MNNEINIHNLGAIDQQQKESDFELGALATAEPIPESYMTPYTGEIEHQHKIPCCGANAGDYIKNIQEKRRHSPAYLWKAIKLVDGFPPQDGTTMDAIFKVLQKRGICDFSLLPNDATVSLQEYTDPKKLTPEMDVDALNSRIGAYAFQWRPTFENLKRAIYENKAVLILLRIGQEWWTPSWREADILPLKAKTPATSGHFVVAIGYDKEYIYFLNGWGKTWGRNGIGYFGEDYMSRCDQMGTCFDYTEKAPYVFKRTMKVGMKGTDVGVLQQILKDKGYFPSTQKITSYFGSITKESVETFQKEHALVADGIVGKLTQAALIK